MLVQVLSLGAVVELIALTVTVVPSILHAAPEGVGGGAGGDVAGVAAALRMPGRPSACNDVSRRVLHRAAVADVDVVVAAAVGGVEDQPHHTSWLKPLARVRAKVAWNFCRRRFSSRIGRYWVTAARRAAAAADRRGISEKSLSLIQRPSQVHRGLLDSC